MVLVLSLVSLCAHFLFPSKTHKGHVGKLNTDEIHHLLPAGSACLLHLQAVFLGSYCHTHMFTSHKWLYFMKSLKYQSMNETNVSHWSLLFMWNICFSHIGTTKSFAQGSSCFVWNWSVSRLVHIVACKIILVLEKRQSLCTYTNTPLISVAHFILFTH